MLVTKGKMRRIAPLNQCHGISLRIDSYRDIEPVERSDKAQNAEPIGQREE